MTLKNLQAILKDITERHKSKVRFFTGLKSDFDPSNEALYPALHVDPINVNEVIDNGAYVINWNMVMELVDKLPEDRTTQDVNNALNRMNEIRKEILVELITNFGWTNRKFNGETTDFTVPAPIVTVPIIDETENNLTGWQSTFTIVEQIDGSEIACCIDETFN